MSSRNETPDPTVAVAASALYRAREERARAGGYVGVPPWQDLPEDKQLPYIRMAGDIRAAMYLADGGPAKAAVILAKAKPGAREELAATRWWLARVNETAKVVSYV